MVEETVEESHAAEGMTVLWSWVPEVVISSQDADRLQRLAKTHVVTQDPMQLVFVQEGEPVNSILQKDKESHN